MKNGGAYKPPYVLTERIVDLVERIGEEVGRTSICGRSLRLRGRTLSGTCALPAVMFMACQAELKSGERTLKTFYSEAGIEEGHFYVHRGILVYNLRFEIAQHQPRNCGH